MFGSKQAQQAEPTLIGRGATVEGTIRATGHVQVDGHVDGILDVDGQVSVGPEGRVTGELSASDVAVGGTVEGKVTARGHLHVLATGRIAGDACYETLQVDRGAVIEGRTLHGDDAPESAQGKVQAMRPSTPPAPLAIG